MPNMATKKAEIISFLEAKNVAIPVTAKTKADLIKLVKAGAYQPTFVVDKMLRDAGIECVRLPPYHCECCRLALAMHCVSQEDDTSCTTSLALSPSLWIRLLQPN